MAISDGVRIDVDVNPSAIPEFKSDLEDAMRRILVLYTTRAKKRAPVDTGTFMRSIDFKMLEGFRGIVGSSDVPGKVWALEHGHSQQAPTGVFRPTAKANKHNFRAILEDALG